MKTYLDDIFKKSRDPENLYHWYEEKLGLHRNKDGELVIQNDRLNFQVEELAPLLNSLTEAGVRIDDHIDETHFGKFAWVFDPEGNRIELWEPPSNVDSIIDLPEPE